MWVPFLDKVAGHIALLIRTLILISELDELYIQYFTQLPNVDMLPKYESHLNSYYSDHKPDIILCALLLHPSSRVRQIITAPFLDPLAIPQGMEAELDFFLVSPDESCEPF